MKIILTVTDQAVIRGCEGESMADIVQDIMENPEIWIDEGSDIVVDMEQPDVTRSELYESLAWDLFRFFRAKNEPEKSTDQKFQKIIETFMAELAKQPEPQPPKRENGVYVQGVK